MAGRNALPPQPGPNADTRSGRPVKPEPANAGQADPGRRARGNELRDSGNLLYRAAVTDDQDRMNGYDLLLISPDSVLMSTSGPGALTRSAANSSLDRKGSAYHPGSAEPEQL
jgi:hypothetical protein